MYSSQPFFFFFFEEILRKLIEDNRDAKSLLIPASLIDLLLPLRPLPFFKEEPTTLPWIILPFFVEVRLFSSHHEVYKV
ncbi:hypothetical protein ACOSQ4_023995 [Xanthoceras sorbifolium]